ncbi:MAG: DUF2974 domain-containing protein [Tissierellia bacterium]|nr:DUF2974 domain-containing protein [Tissierellia bacterium]
MNIIEYVESQMENFQEKPFNTVDSLVLSQLSYLNFSNIVPGFQDKRGTVKISELLKAEKIPAMLDNVRDPKSNHRLLIALGMSPRYRDIRLCYYEESLDIAEEKQFGAITCLIDENLAYIAYKGTDATIVGWKEDFNMAYMSPVPSQVEGAAYLQAVTKKISCNLLVGGHSKGGNIAVYASMECDKQIQDRILKIFSHDGPGFRDEVFSTEKYKKIQQKIHKTLPQSSLVGMLLQHQEDYKVVESNQFWFMQHDPFSWVISDGDFIYTQGLTGGAEHINTVISQWVSKVDDDKRELFISTLYGVVESMGVIKFSDFNDDWYKKAGIALEAARELDPETKRFVTETIKSLLALYMKSFVFKLK